MSASTVLEQMARIGEAQAKLGEAFSLVTSDLDDMSRLVPRPCMASGLNTRHALKYHPDIDMEAHTQHVYNQLCMGKISKYGQHKWAVKVGGALTRRAEERGADPIQYPVELFHPETFLLVHGVPTAEESAMMEQRAINAPECNQVNKRLVVSMAEHAGADKEPRGGAVYLKLVRSDVASSKATFCSAWDEYKLKHPELYDNTLRMHGLDKYSLGKDKYSLGEDKKSQGLDKYSLGEDKKSQGLDKYSLGEDKFKEGLDKYSLGKDKYSLGEDKISLGVDKRSLGLAKAKGHNPGKGKQVYPQGQQGDKQILRSLLNSCPSLALRAAFEQRDARSRLIPLIKTTGDAKLIRAEGQVRGRYKRLQQLFGHLQNICHN